MEGGENLLKAKPKRGREQTRPRQNINNNDLEEVSVKQPKKIVK